MEALKAETTGAGGIWVAPCVCCDGGDVSPGGASAASAADAAKRMIMEPATPRTSNPVPPSWTPSPLAGKPGAWPRRELFRGRYILFEEQPTLNTEPHISRMT